MSDLKHKEIERLARELALYWETLHSRKLIKNRRNFSGDIELIWVFGRMTNQQPFSRLVKSKEMNPIFKALLNFCTFSKIIKLLLLLSLNYKFYKQQQQQLLLEKLKHISFLQMLHFQLWVKFVLLKYVQENQTNTRCLWNYKYCHTFNNCLLLLFLFLYNIQNNKRKTSHSHNLTFHLLSCLYGNIS